MIAARTTGTMPPLTKRERDVLQQVWLGYTSKEAGTNLGISNRTVEVHRVAIYRKTHTASLPELFAHALNHRLISVQERFATSERPFRWRR
jgi:FixJ family two-component response regulator